MTKPIFAINEIHCKGKVIYANSVGEVSDAEYEQLKKMGAGREPRETELALFELGRGKKSAEKDTGRTPAEPQPKLSRAELEKRAEDAGVEFRSNISDEKLLERVIEAESKQSDPEETDL